MATTTEKPTPSQQLLPPELRSDKKPRPVYGKKTAPVLKVAPPKKRSRLRTEAGEAQRRLEFDLKRLAKGKISARALLGLKVEDAARFAALSQAYLSQGDLKVAFAAAEVAVAADPRCVDAWIAKGNALAVEGEENLAISAYQRALALDPGNLVAHVHLADIYIRHLDYSKAALELRTAVALDPDGATAAGARAQYLIARTLAELEKRK